MQYSLSLKMLPPLASNLNAIAAAPLHQSVSVSDSNSVSTPDIALK